jgi:hypothetical protein
LHYIATVASLSAVALLCSSCVAYQQLCHFKAVALVCPSCAINQQLHYFANYAICHQLHYSTNCAIYQQLHYSVAVASFTSSCITLFTSSFITLHQLRHLPAVALLCTSCIIYQQLHYSAPVASFTSSCVTLKPFHQLSPLNQPFYFSVDESKKKRSASVISSGPANKGEDILQSLLSAQSAKEKADQQQR